MAVAEQTARPMHQIKGPSAIGTDPWRFAQLAWTLAATEFKLRFFDSMLGYLWTLMRPLMLFGVLLVVFTQVLDLASGVVLYPQALLLGLVLYTFFSEATSMAVRSIVESEHIVRKVDFPRLAVPVSVVIQALFNLGLNLIVVAVFILGAGGEVRVSWLWIFPLVVLLATLAAGLAMLLSMLFVRYRDVQPIWDVIVTALFYTSPIFFTVELVRQQYDEGVVQWLMVNPFAAILQQARHTLVDPSHPSAADAAGSLAWLLIPLVLGLVLFVIGAQVFRRGAPRVAEEL